MEPVPLFTVASSMFRTVTIPPSLALIGPWLFENFGHYISLVIVKKKFVEVDLSKPFVLLIFRSSKLGAELSKKADSKRSISICSLSDSEKRNQE